MENFFFSIFPSLVDKSKLNPKVFFSIPIVNLFFSYNLSVSNLLKKSFFPTLESPINLFCLSPNKNYTQSHCSGSLYKTDEYK